MFGKPSDEKLAWLAVIAASTLVAPDSSRCRLTRKRVLKPVGSAPTRVLAAVPLTERDGVVTSTRGASLVTRSMYGSALVAPL